MKRPLRIAFGALGLLSLGSLNLQAQVDTPGPAAYAGAPTALLSTAQLDQLTAPIALYPDPLVGQILTAATYPLEIVEAHRWLQDPANAALRGGAKRYLVGSRMTRGFALIAYPTRFGDSGVMTFIVNQNGIVFERSLGPHTERLAAQITKFNPDATWRAP